MVTFSLPSFFIIGNQCLLGTPTTKTSTTRTSLVESIYVDSKKPHKTASPPFFWQPKKGIQFDLSTAIQQEVVGGCFAGMG